MGSKRVEITKIDYARIKAIDDHNGITSKEIKQVLGCSERLAETYKTILGNHDNFRDIFGDMDIVGANVKLAKKSQRYQDLNRIERKAFREYAKLENTLEALNEAVLSEFGKVNFDIRRVKANKIKITGGNQAIIQLADTHFNELVDLDNNHYDFDVASKRMQKYAAEIKRQLKPYNVQKVVLAMTGDMINSDRRLDEKMAMATNRMTAAMIGTNLIQYFIQDLMDEFHQMDIFYVTGNESRSFELGWVDNVVTDNYDSLIFNILKLLFVGKRNVRFFDTNPVETVINVNSKNVLLVHGTTFGQMPMAAMQKIVAKFASKGVTIDYALFGHIHSTMITDLYARSASLVGANAYSDLALGLASSASQNLSIVMEDGTINCNKIDLQLYPGYDGYPIQKDLDAYNTKSADKAHRLYQVVEVARM
jgi:predicted phosphodiesterase/uncharacterized protein (UPF0335 family)